MIQFLVRRIGLALFTCFFISIIAFGVISIPPGDFATFYAYQAAKGGVRPGTQAFKDIEEDLRRRYHLDRPIVEQYAVWFWDTLHWDFGLSLMQLRPTKDLIGERIVMTVVLAAVTITFTWVMAIPIGIYSAVRHNTIGDYTVTFVGFLGLAIPDFLLGLALLWWVYVYFDVLLDGLYSIEYKAAPWSLGKLWDVIKHLWIPAVVLGTSGTAGLVRIMRNNLLDELRRPYVVTARAKGMSEWKLILKYPVRVALNPVISGVGYILPALFSGSIIVSVVLNLPTLGPLLLAALLSQDLYVASTVIFLLGIMTVIGILLSDILLAIADPRVKIETT